MERISYKTLKEEAKLPIAQRKNWDVLLGSRRIATISAQDDISSDRSHSLRIWKAKLYPNAFDPFDFPHHDDEDEKTRPHVVLSNGQPTLINPQPMTMREARSWIKQVVHRGSE